MPQELIVDRLLAVPLLLLNTLVVSTQATADSGPPPNILIILADDMGYGDPGCYNDQSKCPTPNIDRLASQGMRFTDAHSAGAWCTPSRYGLLTGRYAFRTSLAWAKQPVIADDVSTVAATLRDAGYATAMVGKWHLGFVDGNQADLSHELRGGPCDRGFETFFGMPASLDIPDYFWIHDRTVKHPPSVPIADNNSAGWSPVQGAFWRGGLRGEDFVMEDALDRIGDEAAMRIKRLATEDKPFFLYVPLTSPHTPWLPADKFSSADGAGLYSQFVAHTDGVVGRLLNELTTSDVADDTLVIFTSDNGPVWYGQDVQRYKHDSTPGLRGMKGDVWEGGHRVPFIVRWPGRVPATILNDHLTSFVDVHATLAEIAGASLPASAVDSVSHADVWLGESTTPARSELVTFQDPVALRVGNWKLVTKPGSLGFLSHRYEKGSAFLQNDELNPKTPAGKDQPAGQLYDLSSDPGEANNVHASHPDRVAAMKKRLAEIAD